MDDKLDDITKEIDALVTFKSRIEKSIEGCKEPLYIAQQCLLNRFAPVNLSVLEQIDWLKRGYIELTYYVDAIHSGLTSPG